MDIYPSKAAEGGLGWGKTTEGLILMFFSALAGIIPLSLRNGGGI